MISDDNADTVGNVTPGIPKNSSTAPCDQSDNLNVMIAITILAPTPRKIFFVTK